CSVGLGHSDTALEACLVNEFPNAEIHRDGASLRQWIKAILEHFDGQPDSPDLPVDVEGTDFQQRVWDVLRLIPYGRTRTYREVACLVGKPSAPRAVARACAANPVAMVVPCHRVIRKDGGLGGYRWGIERKEALLAREQRGRTTGARQTS
ncbi:MAG: methylated-DNA--[protein]-cysteine S-methyltransferase, partial [Dehalococcoidales bacterium]